MANKSLRYHFFHYLCNIMQRIAIFIIILAMLSSCAKKRTEPGKERFVTDVMLKTTPVKDQGKSPLCWVYAMLATIETQHIMQGDSVNLSPSFVARQLLKAKTVSAFLTRRPTSISMRGMAPGLIHLIGAYGLNQYDAFQGNAQCDYGTLTRKLALLAASARSLQQLSAQADKLLDDNIQPMAKGVYLYGATYTPVQFAHSVCRDDEYEGFTSFTHHPFGAPFILEVPDNNFQDSYMNVPIDSLLTLITSTIKSGHPVCWEGDISEPGFRYDLGTATLTTGQQPVTQQTRQQDFENRRTTDDHCMEICGLAHDQNGQPFFIMKNSWGASNRYGGYMYVSYDYVKAKTICVMVPQLVP